MQRIIALVPAVLTITLCACSTVLTMPTPSENSIKTFQDGGRKLSDAVPIAESLMSSYLENADKLQREERSVGLGLIGLGLIGGDLAVRSVAPNHVLGLGLAGAGLYAGENWSNPRPMRLIYIEGAAALQCALDVTSPMQAAYTRRTDLNTLVASLDSLSGKIDTELKKNVGSSSPVVIQARDASARAKTLIPAARAALTLLDRAGGELYGVVRRVQIEVQRAQAGAAPDFKTLAASLAAQKIFAPTPLLDSLKVKATSAGNEELLKELAADLNLDIQDTQNIIDLVNSRPSLTELQACKIDVAASGIGMKVEPASVVVTAGSSKTVLVSGGVPSYSAGWFGAAPPADQVELRIEPNGVMLITAKATSVAGEFAVLVTDSAKGRERLQVTLQSAEKPKVATSEAVKAGTCTPDAK